MKCPDCGADMDNEASTCDACGATPTPPTVVRGPASPETVYLSGGGVPEAPAAFGRYRVLRRVGRGAMGIVYLARDDKIGRNVAIKALDIDERLPEDEKEEIRQRFEREARAAGMLSNQSIVTVYDVGEQDGVPYIAMEYLEGATLTEIAHDSPLSIPQARSVAAQVLSALAYAHSHDVVHRDIKPDNIFLLPDGRVKVADFGIARISSSTTMTQVGQVMGTPGYMSPEQVKGETVGPASDIFSTGVLLYELLTGVAPFSSTSPTSVMYKIVHEEPRPAHLVNPGVPPTLEAVIARATAKSPSARYPDASEMKRDIETDSAPETAPVTGQPAGGEGTVLRAAPIQQVMPPAAAVPTPTPVRPGKNTALWIGAGAGALLVAAAAAVVLVLVLKGGVGLAIQSPRPGESVASPMKVSLSVSDPSRVDRISLSLDGEDVGTVKPAATCGEEIDPGGEGEHELRVTAYSSAGKVLSNGAVKYRASGGDSAGGTGGSRQDIVGKINEAGGIDSTLVRYADKINDDYLDNNYMPPGFLEETRALAAQAGRLVQSVSSMSAPAGLEDVRGELLRLCGYLGARADAIVNGCQSFASYGKVGDFVQRFRDGQPGKEAFRAEWPPFLDRCRAKGLGV